jgi:hypothetical protein
MTEKRVSVRLAAVGGRQVRAELEGVGEAGARGFGRLSREMEMANTRLASFARQARIAAAAAAGALAAAATAMIRSGLPPSMRRRSSRLRSTRRSRAFKCWSAQAIWRACPWARSNRPPRS